MATSTSDMERKLGKTSATSDSDNSDDDGSWETPSYHKSKVKKPDENITVFIDEMKKQALALATEHSDRIVSVLYSKHGKWVAQGYSTWKEDFRVREFEVIQRVQHVSTTFNPAKQQFGTACAEVCALYFSTVGSSRGWSLAYDARKKAFIGACANCKKLLAARGINDAITHINMGEK